MVDDKIEPYWTESELEEVLYPKGNVIDSDEKIQRDRLKEAIEQQTEGAEDLRGILSAVVNWENKGPAIALWAGHIEKMNELRHRSEDLSSPEATEAALIERFAQPVYQEQDYTKAQLVEKLLPIVRSSPISQLRPDIWEDDERAYEQIRSVLDGYVEKIDWEKDR